MGFIWSAESRSRRAFRTERRAISTCSRLAHLDGLNLSRAWCLRAAAAALPAGDPLLPQLAASAAAHAAAGLGHVATGDYMGEHWLASFAVYLLGVGQPDASAPSAM